MAALSGGYFLRFQADYDSDIENDRRCGPEKAYILNNLEVLHYLNIHI